MPLDASTQAFQMPVWTEALPYLVVVVPLLYMGPGAQPSFARAACSGTHVASGSPRPSEYRKPSMTTSTARGPS